MVRLFLRGKIFFSVSRLFVSLGFSLNSAVIVSVLFNFVYVFVFSSRKALFYFEIDGAALA